MRRTAPSPVGRYDSLIKKLATPRLARESVLVRLATSAVVIFWIAEPEKAEDADHPLALIIRELSTDPTSQAIVESVLSMARKIGWKVIAEGIETEDIVAQLRRMGCHYGQGFLFSKPVSADEITMMIRRQSGA